MANTETSTTPARAANSGAIANPAPLGLCAFALTTFVLSAANAKLFNDVPIVIGLAAFYGGLAQLLAGMWEFKAGNTFGATAFASYGAFWLAIAATLQWHLIPATGHAFGFFLLGWTIFTGLMLIVALRINMALIALFALLLITFLLLTAQQFSGGTEQLGGYFGLATACVAWYTALAGLLASTGSGFTLPVGPRN